MATPTPTIPVTVDTFQIARKVRGSQSDDSYRDGDADPHDLTVDTFHIARGSKGPRSDDSYRDGLHPTPPQKKKQVTKENTSSQKMKFHPNPRLQRDIPFFCSAGAGALPGGLLPTKTPPGRGEYLVGPFCSPRRWQWGAEGGTLKVPYTPKTTRRRDDDDNNDNNLPLFSSPRVRSNKTDEPGASSEQRFSLLQWFSFLGSLIFLWV